jgi:Mlc titration factor MtfA (ptsG expression regulator)
MVLMYWVNKKFLYKKPISHLFSAEQRKIVADKIDFYNHLATEQKHLFEFKVLEFLENTQITGIKTEVTEEDKLLVASSAIIPILAFPNWRYSHLKEVLLYPNSFNYDFDLEGNDRTILGMVGDGHLERKMILSKTSLHQGFANEKDKRNTAIHEFMHIIDKKDGIIDGIPSVLMEHQYVIPWLELMDEKIKEIEKGKSDISEYAATSKVEFFAVLGEYFFERPEQLEKNHPKLFEILERVFKPENV